MTTATPGAGLGLYVHVPFCEAKCAYCHFAIDPRRPDEARQERYLRAVVAEMEAAESGRADTLYFGGGTPSLLAASRLARLVGLARSRFFLPDGAEVTLEANPADLDLALKQGQPVMAKALINRLVPHWVLIAGKEGQEYLIHDPLGDGKTAESLSKYGSNIYGLRIIKAGG